MTGAVGSRHLFSLFGQLGTDISLAPAQQVGGNEVTQHNSTLIGRGHLHAKAHGMQMIQPASHKLGDEQPCIQNAKQGLACVCKGR